MPRVKMPDGQVVDMPEDPTPQQLAELSLVTSPTAMGTAAAPQQQQEAQPSLLGQVGRSIGLTARAGINGLTGTVGLLGDALNSGINMVAGTHLNPVSQSISNLATQAGIPEPQTTGEHISTGIASLMAGSRDPMLGGLTKALPGMAQGAVGGPAAPLYNAPTPTSTLNQTLQAAQAANYRIPPNEAHAGIVGRSVEAMGGKTPIEGMMRQHNVAATDTLARIAAGLPKDAPLTPETLSNAITDTYNFGYKPVTQLGRIPTLPSFHKDLDTALTEFRGASRSFPKAVAPEIEQLVNSYRVPEFDAGDAVRAISQLREDASAAFASGTPALGKANRAVADALENNIEGVLAKGRAAGPKLPPDAVARLQAGQATTHDKTLVFKYASEKNPGAPDMLGALRELFAPQPQGNADLLQNFRDARVQLAKQYAVRDNIIPGSGSVDALKFAAMLRRGAPLTDELKTIGDIASVAPRVTAYPKSAPSLFTGLEGASMLGSGLSSMLGSAAGGAIGAAIPLARVGMRQGLMTGVGQRLLAQPSQGVRLPPALLRALPTGFNMGSGLFGQQVPQ